MQATLLISTLTALSISMLSASESFQADLKKSQAKDKKPVEQAEDVLKKHAKDSITTANAQDELSADVQDLIQEQTDPKLVSILDEAEDLMGEVTERLENKKTGGRTIAIETEIIEKIYEAAKQKQKKKNDKGKPKAGSGAMMEMMKGMMGEGKKPGEDEGEGEGKGQSNSGGEGQEGQSDKASDKTKIGSANNTKEERRVPKNTSPPNNNLPREEQRAIDAYNKSAKK